MSFRRPRHAPSDPVQSRPRGRGAGALHHLPPELRPLIEGAAGCSPYLAGLIRKEGHWLSHALEDAAGGHDHHAAAGGGDLAEGDLDSGLRQLKRRAALLVALADLGGVWSLQTVTQAWTDFADACLAAALTTHVAREARRGKIPGQTEEDARRDGAGMVALAMGKMGAGELNYSSDIDLICLFDETRFDPGDEMEARAGFIRATRRIAATLGETTGEGYVFRTDLRLRPDAGATPVCISMAAAERYYEAEGRSWERSAYIKARPAAGDIAAGERFLETLQPFVWRRHLDFAMVQDTMDMRRRIREHKGLIRTGRGASCWRGTTSSSAPAASARSSSSPRPVSSWRAGATRPCGTAAPSRRWRRWRAPTGSPARRPANWRSFTRTTGRSSIACR
jgi:glutamate-ammonia-ligase adenylyltransferase